MCINWIEKIVWSNDMNQCIILINNLCPENAYKYIKIVTKRRFEHGQFIIFINNFLKINVFCENRCWKKKKIVYTVLNFVF